MLRALKNRFGSTNESGIFSMEASGLQEISNPAGLFLEERSNDASGSVVCACLEGNRPILVEVQALVAKTPYGMPDALLLDLIIIGSLCFWRFWNGA